MSAVVMVRGHQGGTSATYLHSLIEANHRTAEKTGEEAPEVTQLANGRVGTRIHSVLLPLHHTAQVLRSSLERDPFGME
jgi:hypothetical protein